MKNINTIILLLLLWLRTVAQDYTVFTLPTQQMLPMASLHCIYEDKEGYLWYGSDGGGLFRDNGYQIDVFRPSMLSGLPASDAVIDIAESSDGNILAATRAGLFEINKRNYSLQGITVCDTTQQERFPPINALYTTDHIWVGVGDSIMKLSSNGMVLRSYSDFSSNGKRSRTSRFFHDRQGTLFAMQWQGGLFRYEEKIDSFLSVGWPTSAWPIQMTEADTPGKYWVLTWGEGIVLMNLTEGDTCSLTRQKATIGNYYRERGYDLLQDSRHGLLWVSAPDNLYAYHIKGDSLQQMDSQSFLPDGKKIVDQLLEDQSGYLYVAAYTPHSFIIAPKPKDVVRHTIPAIQAVTGYPLLPDRSVNDGRYTWFYQGRMGFGVYDTVDGKVTFASWKSDRPMVKHPHAEGVLTIRGNHLFRVWYDGKEILRETIAYALDRKSIRTLQTDRQNYLWYATDRTLYRHSFISNQTNEISLPSGGITAMAVGTHEEVYIATTTGEVFSINGAKELRQIARVPNNITTMDVAPNGNLWIGTYDGKVYCLAQLGDEPEMCLPMCTSQNISIKDIKVDGMGHVWICTDGEVREYNPESYAFRAIRTNDAFVEVDYFYGLERVGDIRMAINGAGAIVEMQSSAELNRQPSDIHPVVTTVVTGDKVRYPAADTHVLSFSPNERNVELRLTTFEHLQAKCISFAYRLHGIHDEWITIQQGQNRIILPNLPYDNSVLEVKATDRYGCWSNPVKLVTLYRERPWYRTWFAYVLYSILFITLCYGVWHVEHRISLLHRLIHRRDNLRLDEIELRPEEITTTRIEDELLRQAITKVEEHLSDAEYNVEQLSTDLCMSRGTLYRKIQSLTGMSPVEFIRDIRLKQAATLLIGTPDASVSDIAHKVGFTTPSYFTRCFKEKFGVLPKQYSKIQRGTNIPI